MNINTCSSALALIATLASGQAHAQQTELVRLPYPEPPVIDQENFFGESVSRSGDWLFVGDRAARDALPSTFNGAAFAFHRTGSSWELTQVLGGGPSSSFGEVVAIDGNTVAIAAPRWDRVPGQISDNSGKVCIFELQQGTWTLTDELFPDGLPCAAPFFFGSSIALDGDVLAVRTKDCAGFPYGSQVLIYERTQGRWQRVEAFRTRGTPTSPTNRVGNLGLSLAIDGGVIVAGTTHLYGSAVVIQKGPQGWYRSALLTDPASEHGDILGWSAAIDGDTIVLGAPAINDFLGNGHRPGSAAVYERAGNDQWTMVQRLRPSDPFVGIDFGSRFGVSVDIDGDEIAIGSETAQTAGFQTGSVYYFRKTLAGWPSTETEVFVSSVPRLGDRVGRAVSLEDGTIISTAVDLAGGSGEAILEFRREFGDSFCDALPNSTMEESALTLHGSDIADDGVADFFVQSLPPGSVGGLAFALAMTPEQAVFNGNLCLGSPTRRLAATAVIADAQGRASGSIETDALGAAWTMGTTVYFQFWHADTLGLGLSNAVQMTLR